MSKAPGIQLQWIMLALQLLPVRSELPATVTSETLSFSSITLREPRAIEVFPTLVMMSTPPDRTIGE